MKIQDVDVTTAFINFYNTLVMNKRFCYCDDPDKEMTYCQRTLLNELMQIDINKCTSTELSELGFRLWSERSHLYLAPWYWLSLFREGQKLLCIDNLTITVGKDLLDDDVEDGLLAYGIIPIDYNPIDETTENFKPTEKSE